MGDGTYLSGATTVVTQNRKDPKASPFFGCSGRLRSQSKSSIERGWVQKFHQQ